MAESLEVEAAQKTTPSISCASVAFWDASVKAEPLFSRAGRPAISEMDIGERSRPETIHRLPLARA